MRVVWKQILLAPPGQDGAPVANLQRDANSTTNDGNRLLRRETLPGARRFCPLARAKSAPHTRGNTDIIDKKLKLRAIIIQVGRETCTRITCMLSAAPRIAQPRLRYWLFAFKILTPVFEISIVRPSFLWCENGIPQILSLTCWKSSFPLPLSLNCSNLAAFSASKLRDLQRKPQNFC